jgi:SAM-dependent methyltransferase
MPILTLWNNLDRFLKECSAAYDAEGRVLLEIGPSDTHKTAKDYFKKLTIKTMDILPRLKPDFVADLCKDNSAVLPADSFDFVSCCEVLDHVSDPFAAVRELRRVLKIGGRAFVTTPFNLQIHGPFPDCWRYTRMGLENLFKDWEIEKLEHVGDPNHPIQYTLIGRKK